MMLQKYHNNKDVLMQLYEMGEVTKNYEISHAPERADSIYEAQK